MKKIRRTNDERLKSCGVIIQASPNSIHNPRKTWQEEVNERLKEVIGNPKPIKPILIGD